MTAHAGWQRVLLAPLQQRRNQGSRWFWPALVVAALLVLAGAALLPHVPLAWAALTLLATLALGLWIALVSSLIVQNEPHAARLVPGHARALRRVLLVAGLAFLAVAGIVGAAFGHALPTLGATLLALLVVAWIVRMPALGMLGWIVPMLVSRASKSPAFEAMAGATSNAVLARPGWVAAGAAAALLAAVAPAATHPSRASTAFEAAPAIASNAGDLDARETSIGTIQPSMPSAGMRTIQATTSKASSVAPRVGSA